MVELNIIRQPTKEEQKNMIIIGETRPRGEFTELLHKKMQAAAKKGLPFADQVAKEEWAEMHRREARRLFNKYGTGYLTKEAINEFKQPKLEWDRYSDLKNFNLIEEDSQFDPNLTKRHNRQIHTKFKVYKFKEYSKRYTIMEPYADAWKSDKKDSVPNMRDNKPEKTKGAKK